jgi:Leucine-rich repeat (LRR) protein
MELHELEEVHITYSNLPAIGDSSFWPGKRLKVLNLSHNNITIVRDSDFNQLDNLIILNLSHNYLSRAPSASFRHLTNLTTLSLARNKFTKLVPRLFYKLEKLEFLDLSGNPLREIHAEDLKDIKNLTFLNLSKCQLEKIHSLVYKNLLNLTYLDLSDNHFNYLPSREFISLKRLKELRLSGNRLSVLVDNTFMGLHELDILDLSHNSINSLSSCTFCNSSVRKLDISNNKFTSFQSRILEPLSDSLTSLNADANRYLIDSSSSVAYLVQPLKRLNHLSIALNSMDDTIMESTFYNLESLISLNMSRNRLVNISSKLFTPLINLEVLDLSHNQIYGLGDNLFNQIDSISTLKAIYWNDNPWSCYRCHILPVMDWIDSSPVSYFNVCHRYSRELSRLQYCIKCTSPSDLSGKYLHLLNEFDLEWCADPRVQLRLTASEPQIGLILAFLIIISLIVVIIVVIVFYRKQGAVYYTHEDDRVEEKRTPGPVFSVANTTVKRIPLSPHPSPIVTSPPHSLPQIITKPESPTAGPSTTTTTTLRIIRPKVQIYI